MNISNFSFFSFSLLALIFFGSGCNHRVQKNYYTNGSLKSIYEIQNGKIEGIRFDYDSLGNMINQITYQKGKYNGDFKIFSDSNHLNELRIYQDDTLVYKVTYNKNGEIINEQRYVFIRDNIDTLSLGNKFEAKLYLSGPRTNYNMEGFIGFAAGDSVKTLIPMKREGEFFKIDILPTDTGTHFIQAIIRLTSHDSTINIYPFVTWFYVKHL